MNFFTHGDDVRNDLEAVLGYLNFSAGKRDVKFLMAFNRLYGLLYDQFLQENGGSWERIIPIRFRDSEAKKTDQFSDKPGDALSVTTTLDMQSGPEITVTDPRNITKQLIIPGMDSPEDISSERISTQKIVRASDFSLSADSPQESSPEDASSISSHTDVQKKVESSETLGAGADSCESEENSACDAYPKEMPLWKRFYFSLKAGFKEISENSETFRDISQAYQTLEYAFTVFLPAYRKWHKDLLFHQTDDALFQPFFLAILLEKILEQEVSNVMSLSEVEQDAFTDQIILKFDDFVGYRPVAVIYSREKMETYRHERVRAIPLYIKGAGVAYGPYHDNVTQALTILKETPEEILRQGSFNIENLQELSYDPRALDFEHPVNRRLNYHFGGWDPDQVDIHGYYSRFVLIETTVQAILARVVLGESSLPREELLYEASAVLSGTILMGAAVSGWGPGSYDSSVTFSVLLPKIAEMRDQFYANLLTRITGRHASRLKLEEKQLRQPFAGTRHFFNHRISYIRAVQYQNVQLARLYAWMGYREASEEMVSLVQVPSARVRCKIDCLLTLAHLHLDRDEVQSAIPMVYEVEQSIKDAIQYGALVGPWNILGFSGQFPLSSAVEDSTVDQRVDELITLIGSLFSLYARIMKEATARGMKEECDSVGQRFMLVTQWWDQYGSTSYNLGSSGTSRTGRSLDGESVEGISGKDTWDSTKMVVDALEMWHKAGTASGDVGFWRPLVTEFHSAKAYSLLTEALLDQHDPVASMALLVSWLNNADTIPLNDGEYSFHPLALRWMEDLWYPPTKQQRLQCRRGEILQDAWPLAKKFVDYLEANAEEYLQIPHLEVENPQGKKRRNRKNSSAEDELGGDKPAENKSAGDNSAEKSSGTGNTGTESLENDIPVEKPYLEDKTDRTSSDSDIQFPSGDDEDAPYDEFNLEGAEELEDMDEELTQEDLYSAAWENVVYRDTTDDGVDSSMKEQGGEPLENFALYDEVERISNRLLFIITMSRLWKMSALFSISYADKYPDRSEVLSSWRAQAHQMYTDLQVLVNEVGDFGLDTQGVTPQEMIDYEKRRSMKEMLLERIISTCVEVKDAQRLMLISDTRNRITTQDTWEDAVQCVTQALICSDVECIHNSWGAFLKLMAREPLLYQPISRGGDLKRIVSTRSVLIVLQRLLYNLPRLGLLSETYQVLLLAQVMEQNHPAGMRAITRFDYLFQLGCQGIVRHILRTAKNNPDWTRQMETECLNTALDTLLSMWLAHSQSIRVSSLDGVTSQPQWVQVKQFIKLYGNDLFTPMMLAYGNLQAIQHQGVLNWIKLFMAEDEQSLEFGKTLHEALHAGNITEVAAAQNMEIIVETLQEHYGEFLDYNSTSTQSDHGENLFMFLDFLLLLARYDRKAWEQRPSVLFHEVMVREKCMDEAEIWLKDARRRTQSQAMVFIQQYKILKSQYGIHVKSVSDRVEERFITPMLINHLCAMLEPAVQEARQGGHTPSFTKFRELVRTFTEHPAGAGFEPPRWLMAVEEEVQRYRNRSEEDDEMQDLSDFVPLRFLSYEDTLDMLRNMRRRPAGMFGPIPFSGIMDKSLTDAEMKERGVALKEKIKKQEAVLKTGEDENTDEVTKKMPQSYFWPLGELDRFYDMLHSGLCLPETLPEGTSANDFLAYDSIYAMPREMLEMLREHFLKLGINIPPISNESLVQSAIAAAQYRASMEKKRAEEGLSPNHGVRDRKTVKKQGEKKSERDNNGDNS